MFHTNLAKCHTPLVLACWTSTEGTILAACSLMPQTQCSSTLINICNFFSTPFSFSLQRSALVRMTKIILGGGGVYHSLMNCLGLKHCPVCSEIFIWLIWIGKRDRELMAYLKLGATVTLRTKSTTAVHLWTRGYHHRKNEIYFWHGKTNL